jgi:hypothetical protein
VQRVDLGSLDGLTMTRRPANQDSIDLGMRTQPEVETPLILGAESATPADFLDLFPTVPVQLDPRTNRASIAP